MKHRTFFGYTIALSPNSEDPGQEVYSDAYGLEMSYDDEWPVETVFFVPPHHVSVVTEQTGLRSEGVQVGAQGIPMEGTLRSLAESGATWVLLFANESSAAAHLYDAVSAGLGVVLVAAEANGLAELVGQVPEVSSHRLVVALHPHDPATPAQAQNFAAAARTQLAAAGHGDCRVVFTIAPTETAATNYTAQSDIDGLLVLSCNFESAVELLREVAEA